MVKINTIFSKVAMSGLLMFSILLGSCSGEEEIKASITSENFTTTINENPEKETSLGSIVASVNTETGLMYSISSQSASGAVVINSSTGELSVSDIAAFDYEENIEITGIVSISTEDKDTSENIDFSVSINDIHEVLILGADLQTGVEAIATLVNESGEFEIVDSFISKDALITLDKLKEYDAVLCYTNYSPVSSSDLGDVLALYIENGGGLVEAVFGGNISISGNYDNYKLYDNTAAISQKKEMVELDKVNSDMTQEIFNGVDSFGGNVWYNTNIVALSDATQIAVFDNGEPLTLIKENVGEKNARSVFLNFFPNTGYWDTTTDGGVLMANALIWASNK